MAAVQPGLIPAAIAATSATPPMPYTLPMGYPGFFGMPTAAPGKPGEAPTYTYPAAQYYLAPFPMAVPPQAPGQEGEAAAPYPTGFYPITFAPYGAQPYPTPYMVPAPAPVPPPRALDGQPQQQPGAPPPPPAMQPVPVPIQQLPMTQMQMPMQVPVAGMAQMQMQMPMTAMPAQALQYAAYPPPPPPPHHYASAPVNGGANGKDVQREGRGGGGGPGGSPNGHANGGEHGHHQHQHPHAQQQMVDSSAGGRRDVRLDQYGGRVSEGMSGVHGKAA